MKYINQASIDSLKELQKESGYELLNSLIQIYLEQAPQMVKQIQGALIDKNLDTIRAVAHSLKSSSATLGAESISNNCKALEDEISLASTPNMTLIQGWITELSSTMPPVLMELKKIMQPEDV